MTANAVKDDISIERFTTLEKRLLNDFQHDFPVCERPFLNIANSLDCDEETVIKTLQSLVDRGIVSRVGPVFKPNRIGVSTLAAMAVPDSELTRVADIVSAYGEVNHNYERLHRFNLWFVVTTKDDGHLDQVLQKIEENAGYKVMSLPMQEDFFIDLGFNLKWI